MIGEKFQKIRFSIELEILKKVFILIFPINVLINLYVNLFPTIV